MAAFKARHTRQDDAVTGTVELEFQDNMKRFRNKYRRRRGCEDAVLSDRATENVDHLIHSSELEKKLKWEHTSESIESDGRKTKRKTSDDNMPIISSSLNMKRFRNKYRRRRGCKDAIIRDGTGKVHLLICSSELEKTSKGDISSEETESNDNSYQKTKTCDDNMAVTSSSIGQGTKEEEEDKYAKGCSVLEIDHLLGEILIRVPWKQLNCCKSVLRQWQQVISEPSFVAKHHDRNLSLLGFFYDVDTYVNFIPVSSPLDYFSTHSNSVQRRTQLVHMGANFTVLCSSNGLVLHLELDKELFFMHNPITSQIVRLPPPLPIIFHFDFIVYGLAFVPCASANRPPYSVVVEVISTGGLGLRVNSFSSETCSWESQVHNSLPFLTEGFSLLNNSTFLNGSLHWLLKPSGIIAYNIKTKHFSFLNVPGDTIVQHCDCLAPGQLRYLGDSQENLIYVRVIRDFELSVWTLDDYYLGKWSTKHRVIVIDNNLPCLSRVIPWVLAFDPRDSQILFVEMAGNVYSCHLETGEIKEIQCIPEFLNINYPVTSIVPYKLPRYASSSVPPECCFSCLFGDSLCYGGTCGNNIASDRKEGQIELYAHVHERNCSSMEMIGHPAPEIAVSLREAFNFSLIPNVLGFPFHVKECRAWMPVHKANNYRSAHGAIFIAEPHFDQDP